MLNIVRHNCARWYIPVGEGEAVLFTLRHSSVEDDRQVRLVVREAAPNDLPEPIFLGWNKVTENTPSTFGEVLF